MSIAAGSLNRRVILQRPAFGDKNAFGEPADGFVTVKVVSAAKLNLPGAERLRAAEVAGQAPLRFQIRWGPEWADLDNTWRILYGQGDPVPEWPAYNIEAFEEMDLHEGFDIRAVARAEGT